jgi:hypothetical protein
VYAVEPEPETRGKPLVWTPAQVAHFLDFHAADRLIFLWRLALLRGFRRGKLTGMADDALDTSAGTIAVNVALAQIGSRLSRSRGQANASASAPIPPRRARRTANGVRASA